MIKTLKIPTVLIFIVGFLFFSCSNGTSNQETEGTIAITLSQNIARTIVPSISMIPTNFSINGTGPNGNNFTTSLSGSTSTYTTPKLQAGQWTITVTATNINSTQIGTGTGTATITAGNTTPVSITVSPITGTGTLNLTTSWPSGTVTSPSFTAYLTPVSGNNTNITFGAPVVSGLTQTSTATLSNVPTGYYTLIVELFDGTNLATGWAEVVRIINGQTTNGTITFTSNQITTNVGQLNININVALNDPLPITITGNPSTSVALSTLPITLTAGLGSGSSYTGNVTYAWYINGNYVSTGTTASFTATTAATYIVSVTGYSADGSRAGSQNVTIQVTN